MTTSHEKAWQLRLNFVGFNPVLLGILKVRGIRPCVRLRRLCCTLLFSWRKTRGSVGMPIDKVDSAEATET